MFKETSNKFKEPRQLKKGILKTRDGDHLIPGIDKEKDSFFPPTDQLSYANYIVGFQFKKKTSNSNYYGMKILMKNGEISNTPLKSSRFQGDNDQWS